MTAIPMAATLLLYFYFEPDIPSELAVLFVAVWLACFYLDAKITVANIHLLKLEKNVIFPFLYRRLGNSAVVFQILAELAAAIVIWAMFEGRGGPASLGVALLVLGTAHFEAYISNRATIGRLGDGGYL